MSDILTAMREFRSLDDRRRAAGLSAEDEARWNELRAAVKGERNPGAAAAPAPVADDAEASFADVEAVDFTTPSEPPAAEFQPAPAPAAPDESGWTWHAESGLYWHAWAQHWYDPASGNWFDASGASVSEEAAQAAVAAAIDPAYGIEAEAAPVQESEAPAEDPWASSLLPVDPEPAAASGRDGWAFVAGPEAVTPGPAGATPLDLWSVHAAATPREEPGIGDAPTPWSVPADEMPSEEEQAPLSAPESLRPELLPFEVSSIRTLPEVDESAIEAGFDSWPPAEDDAAREPTFGPGRAMEVPWDASAGPQQESAEEAEPVEADELEGETVEFSPGPSLDAAALVPEAVEAVETVESIEAEAIELPEADAVELASAADFLPQAAQENESVDPEQLEEIDEAELEEVDADLPAAVEAIVLEEEPLPAQFVPPPPPPAPAPAPAKAPQQQREEWFPPTPTPWSLTEQAGRAVAQLDAPGRGVVGGAPGLIFGEYRVVIHTREGVVKRGAVRDANLASKTLAFYPPSGTREDLATAALKVVFFMRAPGEPEPMQQGRRVRITFPDGRPLVGFAEDLSEREGFFLVPADTRGNTARIWVYRDAVRELALE